MANISNAPTPTLPGWEFFSTFINYVQTDPTSPSRLKSIHGKEAKIPSLKTLCLLQRSMCWYKKENKDLLAIQDFIQDRDSVKNGFLLLELSDFLKNHEKSIQNFNLTTRRLQIQFWHTIFTKKLVLVAENQRIKTLPEGLKVMTQLKYIYLSNNQISHIPDWFKNFTSLAFLELCGNPVEISTLPKLPGQVRKIALQQCVCSNPIQKHSITNELSVAFSGLLLFADIAKNFFQV